MNLSFSVQTVYDVEWNIANMWWDVAQWDDQEIETLLKKAASKSRLFFWCIEPVAIEINKT